MNNSRRNFLLSVSSAALAASALSATRAYGQEKKSPNAAAAKAAGLPAPLETLELEKDLFVIMGAGGNIAVHRSDDTALVIDAGLPDRAADTLAAVEKIVAGAKQKTLFNTHWHFDHVGGNVALGGAGYTIVASSLCRQRLSEEIFFQDLNLHAKPLPLVGRPAVTFTVETTLYAPSPVRLTKVPPTHTDTDAVATFEQYNVFHTGDIFFNGAFPVIDRSTGGSLDNMISGTERLLSMVNDSTRIIPGHGPIASKADLVSQLALLKECREKLAPFGEKKTPLADVLSAAPLAYLDDKWGRGFVRSPLFTKMAYPQWL